MRRDLDADGTIGGHDRPSCASILAELVTRHGGAMALHSGSTHLSYADLAERIERKVQTYRSAGIGETSLVGAVADDPVEFTTDVFALLRLQSLVILIPADMKLWEFERLSSRICFTDFLFTHTNMGLKFERKVGRNHVCMKPAKRRRDRVARIGFITSGTSGRPKIAVRSEAALLVEALSIRKALNFKRGRRMASILPLSHAFPFTVSVFAGLMSGVELFFYPRSPASTYLGGIQADGIELLPLVPPQLRLLADASMSDRYPTLSVLSAGGHLDQRTLELARKRLGCSVGQVFGSSETGIITIAPPDQEMDSVGSPPEHVTVELSDVSVEAAGERVGIVAVRSDALFDGYLDGADIDPTPVASGRFSTGDRAYFRAGRLVLLGRLSSAINVAGYKVSPEEIESALLEFPCVHQALVIGVDDPLVQQRIKAYVAPASVDLAALRRFCQERLSPSKWPQYYSAVSVLQTTGSGKIIRLQDPEALP